MGKDVHNILLKEKRRLQKSEAMILYLNTIYICMHIKNKLETYIGIEKYLWVGT